MAPPKKSNGNMKFVFSNSNILKEKNNSSLMNSIDQSMKFTKRLVLETLFSRRSTRQSRKVWKLKMLKLTNFQLQPRLTHRHWVSLEQLWKRLKTLRVMLSERSKPPSRKLERLTPTWSRPTKVNSVSSVSQLKSLDLIHLSQPIFDIYILFIRRYTITIYFQM